LVEPSGDTHARGAFAAAESTGDLGERKLFGDAELDGPRGGRGKLLERRRQCGADGAQVRELLDAGNDASSSATRSICSRRRARSSIRSRRSARCSW
jgi:hypothetical protein